MKSWLFRRRTTRDGLPFAPVTEDIENAPPEPEWLWEGFLALRNLTLLAGRPKTGKSTLVSGLLAALQRGDTFAGRATRETGALVLTEERIDGLVEKARRFGLGERIYRLRRDQFRGLGWPAIVAQAVDYAHAKNLGLLVVDTFAELGELEGDAENDSGAIMAALRPLQRAADSGLAVLVVAHQRKAGGRNGDAVRGSNALIGAADIIVELERAGKDTGRTLQSVSRFSSTPARLPVDLVGDDYVLREPDQRADDALILAALEKLGPATHEQISDTSGVSLSTVKRSMPKLGNAVTSSGLGKKGDPLVWERAAA